jgi:hypothetical protein
MDGQAGLDVTIETEEHAAAEFVTRDVTATVTLDATGATPHPPGPLAATRSTSGSV